MTEFGRNNREETLADTGNNVVSSYAYEAWRDDTNDTATLREWHEAVRQWFDTDIESALYMTEQSGDWF